MDRETLYVHLISILIIIITIGLIFSRLIINSGMFYSWGNLIMPTSPDQIRIFFIYNYKQMITTPTALTSLYNTSIAFFLGLINGRLFPGVNFAVIFILFTVTVYAFSFYFLTTTLTKNWFARLLPTLFILLNPSSLKLYSSGDYSPILAFGFLFLSLAFLMKSNTKRLLPDPLFLIALFFFTLTITVYFVFYLGFLVFFTFGIIHSVENERRLRDVLKFFAKFVFLIPMLLPFLILVVLSRFNIGLSSSIIVSLNTVISYDKPPLSLLLAIDYPSLFSVGFVHFAAFSQFLYHLYMFGLIALIALVVIFPFLKRQLLYSTISILIIIFTLIGGYPSPLWPFFSFLYTHLFGFQVLDESNMWQYFIYFFLAINILGFMESSKNISDIFKRILRSSKLKRIGISNFHTKISSQKFFAFLVVVLLLIVSIPVMSQGYYSQGGIHSNVSPVNFNAATKIVKSIDANDRYNVMVLPADSLVFYKNLSNRFNDPLMVYPSVPTLEIPSYGEFASESQIFTLWLVYELYVKHAPDLAQLLALDNVKYIVLMNKLESASYYPYYVSGYDGINVSQILSSESHIFQIYNSANLTIYENALSFTGLLGTNKLVLLEGDFNTLSYLANRGIQIYKVPFMFPTDLGQNFWSLLNSTSTIIATSNDSAMPLLVQMLNSNGLNLLSNASVIVHSKAWQENTELGMFRSFSLGSSFPYLYSYSDNSTLNLTLNDVKSGNYKLLVQYLLPDQTFSENAMSVEVNSNKIGVISNVYSNSLPINNFSIKMFNLHSSGSKMIISLKSLSGLNGISSVILVNASTFDSASSKINDTIRLHNIQIVDLPYLYSLPAGIMMNYSVSYGLTGYKIHYIDQANFSYLIFRESYLNGFGASHNNISYYSLLSGVQSMISSSYQHDGTLSITFSRISYFYLAVGVELTAIVIPSILFIYNKRRRIRI